MRSPEEQHKDLVNALARTIRESHSSGSGHRSAKNAPYYTSRDVPGLDKVVTIDLDTSTALVEANMTMETLVQITMKFGRLPAVVAGSRSVTVADAFAAQSSESSSFAFGTFDCTITGVELIFDSGQIAHLRPNDELHTNLFYGSASSRYCPGLITMFEISLIRAGPCVELTFQPKLEHRAEATGKAQALAQALLPVDFIEHVVFQDSLGVIVTGCFAPAAACLALPETAKSAKLLEITRAVSHSQTKVKLAMPTASYLFRNEDRRVSSNAGRREAMTLERDIPPCDRWMMLQDFGVLFGFATSLTSKMKDAHAMTTIWLTPVLQPTFMGRQLRHGVGPAFDYSLDLWALETFYRKKILLDPDVEATTSLGWLILSNQAPCKRGMAQLCSNDWWHR